MHLKEGLKTSRVVEMVKAHLSLSHGMILRLSVSNAESSQSSLPLLHLDLKSNPSPFVLAQVDFPLLARVTDPPSTGASVFKGEEADPLLTGEMAHVPPLLPRRGTRVTLTCIARGALCGRRRPNRHPLQPLKLRTTLSLPSPPALAGAGAQFRVRLRRVGVGSACQRG